MSTLRVNATQRLANATQVKAATNLKGAVAFLKKNFTNEGLQVKSVDVVDKDEIHFVFKGPFGTVDVGFQLMETGAVYVELLDSDGITPKYQGQPGQLDAELVLKGKKNNSKSLNSKLKLFDKELTRAHDYFDAVEKCYEWMRNFQAALQQIEAEMDKAKPKRRK